MPAGRAAILSKPNVINPGLALLQNSTLWLDAGDAVVGAQWLRNKGTGGRALDARVGSVGSAQIINGALKLPGATGNWASTPNAAALNFSGDLEIILRLGLNDWTPATAMMLLAKRDSSGTNYSYSLNLSTSGVLGLEYGTAGNGYGAAAATAAIGETDGTVIWVRVTRSVSSGDVNFYKAADSSSIPTSWTQVGSTVSTVAVNHYALGSQSLMIGAAFQPNPFQIAAGTFLRAIVRNGIGGTIVFDADFTTATTLATSFTESSSNAATVTINSTTGVDTNDPLSLPHTGTNYLYLPLATGNYASTPDAPALDVVGDIDMIVHCAADDWTTGASQMLIAKCDGSPAISNIAYSFHVGGTGTLALQASNGTTIYQSASSVPISATDGSPIWLRVLHTTASTLYYTSPDGTNWTQLGTPASARVNPIQNNAFELRIGHYGLGANHTSFGGKIFRAQVWSGNSTSGGTKVFDANFSTNTNQDSFTESSSNAAAVTINRATSGRKSVIVTRPTLLFGTDDYLSVADNNFLDFNAEDFTVLMIMRQFANPTANARFISKRDVAGSNPGYELIHRAAGGLDYYGLYDSGTGDTGTGSWDVTGVAGLRSLTGFVVDDSAATLTTFNNGSFSTPRTLPVVRDVRNTVPFEVGRLSGSTSYGDFECEHVLLFRSALTSVELDQIASYLGVS